MRLLLYCVCVCALLSACGNKKPLTKNPVTPFAVSAN